jgi:hypothetical protein
VTREEEENDEKEDDDDMVIMNNRKCLEILQSPWQHVTAFFFGKTD